MTGNALGLVVFNRKLVVIAQFVAHVNVLFGVNDNALDAVERNDFGVAVGVATGIDESSDIALFGGVAHNVRIDSKHVVAANLGRFVLDFATFGDGIANEFTPIFDNHFTCANRHVGKDAPGVNAAPIKTQLRLATGQGIHCRGQDEAAVAANTCRCFGKKGHILHEPTLTDASGSTAATIRLGRFIGALFGNEPSGSGVQLSQVARLVEGSLLYRTSAPVNAFQNARNFLEGIIHQGASARGTKLGIVFGRQSPTPERRVCRRHLLTVCVTA